MLIIPCVVGLVILAQPIIKYLFEYGAWNSASTVAVARAITIQALVLPAMLASQIYSKTLYASQDVTTPVRTSMVSLGVAAGLYATLYPIMGYLAIPVGVVVSGYLKNWLLGRACKKRQLINHDARTLRAIVAFGVWAGVLGIGLGMVSINSIWMLGAAIGVYAVAYLPVAWLIDRRL